MPTPCEERKPLPFVILARKISGLRDNPQNLFGNIDGKPARGVAAPETIASPSDFHNRECSPQYPNYWFGTKETEALSTYRESKRI